MNQLIFRPPCPPPRKFIPAGFVTWAQFLPGEPDYIAKSKKKVTGARAQGLRYERKSKEMLEKRFADWAANGNPDCELLLGPWINFKSSGDKLRYCQPDALLIDTAGKSIVIFEIKLQHTAQAWWQVRKLYEPVLERIYSGFSFTAIEVVKWFDAHQTFPETFYYAENPFDLQLSRFGVHIYDGRR